MGSGYQGLVQGDVNGRSGGYTQAWQKCPVPHQLKIKLEAEVGIEPAYTELQSPCLKRFGPSIPFKNNQIAPAHCCGLLTIAQGFTGLIDSCCDQFATKPPDEIKVQEPFPGVRFVPGRDTGKVNARLPICALSRHRISGDMRQPFLSNYYHESYI